MDTGKDDEASARAQARAPRVLIAEDDPASARLIEIILTSLGYHVRLVADGRAAVQAMEAEPHDVVIMDIRLPVLDGMAAARMIRDMPDARGGAPIIGMAAHAGTGGEAEALAAGMTICLPKPLDVARLTKTLAAFAGDAPHMPLAGVSRSGGTR